MSIVRCMISGVRYHVSSISVRYQVSGNLNTESQHYMSGNHLVM